jgi:hypothetical protein
MWYWTLDKKSKASFGPDDPDVCLQKWELKKPPTPREGLAPGLVEHTVYWIKVKEARRTEDDRYRYVSYRWVFDREREIYGENPHVEIIEEVTEVDARRLGARFGDTPADDPPAKPVHDGLHLGRYLAWQGQQYDIPQGVIYRLLEHMWDRESATYDELFQGIFDAAMDPKSVRSRVHDANRRLARAGVPWSLHTETTWPTGSAVRCVVKRPFIRPVFGKTNKKF